MPPAFLLPAGLDALALSERLEPLGRAREDGARTQRYTLLDSFDWRLHHAGWRLEAVGGPRPLLRLRPLGGGRPLATLRAPAPRRASDLPPGPLRERLAGVLDPRALLPLVVADVTVTRLCLATRGRPPVTLSLESAVVGPPGAAPSLPLRPALVVPAGPRAAALRALVCSWADSEPAPDDAVATLLEPLGRVPRDYSGKIRVPLEPALPARTAARAVLLHLLGTLEANLPGVHEDLDPEFLHDFRVAVRRTRSALGQIKGVLPPATAAHFTRAFARLQELTGPARDLDVYVLELPALARLLPPRARRSLGPLARLLERRRREAYGRLAAALDEPAFAALLARWRAFLMAPTPARPRGAPNALRPAGAVAAERIGRLLRRALREGSAIDAASPAADLHELRKTCKKLRYLVEFFQSLLAPEAAAAAIESLKGLQDVLGRHQDLQVQADALLGYARELARERKAPPPAYLAVGMLVERLRDEQRAARLAFAERFADFSRKSNRRNWRRLFAVAAAAPAAPADQEPEHG
ncbi:MAG TPA: CHAD domain-containing protein [Candidatus Methanoperedens sp.]|nr:CHAD domain-containing protein [Candidatus Methanoperedens sp.]